MMNQADLTDDVQGGLSDHRKRCLRDRSKKDINMLLVVSVSTVLDPGWELPSFPTCNGMERFRLPQSARDAG